jgi:hypothetical protein
MCGQITALHCTTLLSTCLHAGFLLSLFFDTADGGDVSPKRLLTFNGLHGVITQMIKLFKLKAAPSLSTLWNPKISCRVQQSPQPVVILSQMNPVNTIPSYLGST